MGSRHKYTKELLEPIVAQSISVAEVLRKLKRPICGGIHTHVSKRIRELGIDTSHFLGSKANSVIQNYPTKLSWDQILVKRNNNCRQNSHRLRRALIESGRPYVCVACGLNGCWNGRPITLEVNHKNRDWLNDSPDNVEFICPNCHSQTHGWSGRKELKLVTKKIPQKQIPTMCKVCGNPKKTTKGQVCQKCYNENRDQFQRDTTKSRKVIRPSYEQLKLEIEESSFVAVGKKYGVSDNAVRKWLRQYEK